MPVTSAEHVSPFRLMPASAAPTFLSNHTSTTRPNAAFLTSDPDLQSSAPSQHSFTNDEDLNRLGFLAGAAASPALQASWGAPAVDAVYMHPHLNVSAPYLPTHVRPPMQYPAAPLSVHRPTPKDPWAQTAVWRPSLHSVSPQPPNTIGGLDPNVVGTSVAPVLPSSPIMSFGSESKLPRRRRRNGTSRDLSGEHSSSSSPCRGRRGRFSADSDVNTTGMISTPNQEPGADPNRTLPSGDGHAHHHQMQLHSQTGSARGTNVSVEPSRGSHGSTNGHPSVREYNRRISAYARRRDLNGALRTLGELDRAPKISRNLFTYNAVINALVMCSQHAKADEFWQEMQESGIEPNLVTFNTMLKSCFGGMDEDVQRAFRLLREMEERGISADRVTLNSLINACVSAGRVRDAQGVYEEMRRLNIEPDAYTFCTLAKQARHQCDVSMLDALLLHQLNHHTVIQQRKSSSGSVEGSDPAGQVSPVAYNTIADAYIRCGYPSRAIGLLERLRDSKSNVSSRPGASEDVIPVCPDVQTFNVRLKALRESGAPANEAFQALEEMRTLGLEADHITLLTLADLCCRRGEMALAEGVLHAATEADIKEYEKGSLEWKAHCSGGRHAGRKGAESGRLTSHTGQRQTFSKRQSGPSNSPSVSSAHSSSRRNANQPRNAKANAALFNALIRGYSSLDPPNVDAAVALYVDMRRFVEDHGFSWYAADSVTYTMLVDGFARIGDAARAELIISEMEAAGRANVVAYNAYLKANRGNGYTAALSVLERMKNIGLRPDVVTYNTVIDFLSSEENGSQIAEELVLEDMPRNGVRPDLLTFNTLIKGVARNRGNKTDASAALGAAYRWLQELQARGLRPDEFTYQSMVSACAAAGDAPRALEFFRKVEAERANRSQTSRRANPLPSGNSAVGAHGPVRNHLNVAPSSSPQLQPAVEPPRVQGSRWSNAAQQLDSRELTTHSYQQQSPNDWMLLPHPAAYIALMRAFLSSSATDGVDSVLFLRDEMVKRGLELGRTGYTAVADAYAERGDFDSVEATLREMLSREGSKDQKLSPVHHCIRMKALCNSGRLDDAIAIIPEVENADTAVFNVLIFACAKNRDMDRMITVLRAMESSKIEPDAITSRALSSMMRNVARTLKSFDERFRANITAFVAEGHGQSEVKD